MEKCCMSGEEIALLATSIAISIVKGCSEDELDLLSNLYQAIGANIALISAGRGLCTPNDSGKD